MNGFLRKIYGPAGLLIVAVMQAIAIFDVKPLEIWVTPVGWYGYILFMDWLVYLRRGMSLLTAHPREFLWMLPISVALWSLFEAHNLLFRNWEYVGLPASHWVRNLGFILSFSTVLPAIWETDQFLKSRQLFRFKVKPHRYSKRRCVAEMFIGMLFIAVPTVFPSEYTGPLVWAGYPILFAPLNYMLGFPSVLKEREEGEIWSTVTLAASGYICGLVWEFLNFWAGAKWVYHVPYMENVKIFEMPLLGFLGFGPFAVAIVEMYRFVRYFPTLFSVELVRSSRY